MHFTYLAGHLPHAGVVLIHWDERHFIVKCIFQFLDGVEFPAFQTLLNSGIKPEIVRS